jgi:hypothetical protein
MTVPSNPTNDAAARREAAELLDIDPERLCASDRLKVDLVCSLRAAVDYANAGLIGGNSADLSRLVSAVEQLTKLLPARQLEPPEPTRSDPREALLQMIMQARRNGGISENGTVVDGLRAQVIALAEEVEQLKAELAAPTLVEPSPMPANVVPLARAAAPAPAAPATGGILCDSADEAWRGFVGGGGRFDRWSNRNE